MIAPWTSPARQNRMWPPLIVDTQQSVVARKDFDQKRTDRQQGKQTVNDVGMAREDSSKGWQRARTFLAYSDR